MEATSSALKQIAAVPWATILMILILVVVVGYVSSVFMTYPLSGLAGGSGMASWYIPGVRQFVDMGADKKNGKGDATAAASVEEGFFGGVVRGAGHPDCLRDLQAGAELFGMMQAAAGTGDYAEFQVLLSKMGCLKKDLMSPSGIVQATLYQPYATSHDREPVAEVAATCLAKTIPERDLEIVFATWRDRGNVLIRRLCTLANFKEQDAKKAEQLFTTAWTDVYEVARGRCLTSPSESLYQSESPHDAQPYEPPQLEDLQEYKGYYSGWAGQI
jgi:hypothetical protein